MSDDKIAVVKSADRTLTVLEYLAETGSARTLAEIADALQLPKSSVHGLLRNLLSRGWLSTDGEGAGVRYRIGPQALTVGAAYVAGDDIVRRSESIFDALSAELGETVHLGILDGTDIVYLAKRDAAHSLRLVSGIGIRLPAYATALGKMLMARADERTLARILDAPRRRLTAKTLVDEGALLDDLEQTRVRGYAVDDEESTEGVRCFAVALGTRAPFTHAISCSVPIARLSADFEGRVIGELIRAAERFAETERPAARAG